MTITSLFASVADGGADFMDRVRIDPPGCPCYHFAV
jgi:hypothetical protein